MAYDYSEDKLVQQTTANYFKDKLGWESVYAYNDEILGLNGTLGRISEREVVLVRYLRKALENNYSINSILENSSGKNSCSRHNNFSSDSGRRKCCCCRSNYSRNSCWSRHFSNCCYEYNNGVNEANFTLSSKYCILFLVNGF